MVNTTTNGNLLDEETRNEQIVANLRGERVSLYKEFNDAFKEYTAKRMTPEEYATICRIVTEGFVELSIEILALEAHLGGPSHVTPMTDSTDATTAPSTSETERSSSSTTVENTSSTPNSRPSVSLNSPEHAQLIRQVQLLEKRKLAVTVQRQKWVMEKDAQEAQDQKDKEAELQADRVVCRDGAEVDDDEADQKNKSVESQVQAMVVQDSERQAPSNAGELKLSVEEWQVKLDENQESLNQIIEEINDKLADIQEAIAVLVL
ncbi:hypothetical protein BG011_010199 [Mortierella polycephala]|uniref:Uncharacterized protein n=1 Tax=Mortierella polycephala TaxID=41804 RepID=A0A9P6QBR2_9FUNG|nr:hypothetical protein BG011_010199 [Mortierella polycephala]